MTGTAILLRAAYRRDRVMLVVWVYALMALFASSAYSFRHIYPTAADRDTMAVGANHVSAEVALYGHLFYPATPGSLVAWRCVVFGAAFAGIMSVMLVVRHTRAEEESGRLELLRAGVLGRLAAPASAVAVALTANLLVALLATLVMVVLGLPLAGSAATALAVAFAGAVFAGVAAVTAQVSESARTARGLALVVIAVAYVVRAAGDIVAHLSWLTWLSPIGWAEHIEGFAGDRWWVLALPVVAMAVLAVVAAVPARRRDLGAGLLAPRPGPVTAGRSLRGVAGLAWRLQRGTLFAWTVGLVLLGAVVGAVTKDVVSQLSTPSVRSLMVRLGGTQNLVDAFLAAEIDIVALMVGAAAVQVMLRARTEESEGRAEPLLATAVGRTRWAASHLAAAFLGSAFLIVIAGLAIGVTYGATIGDVGGQVPRLLGASLAQVPPVWVMTGIALATFGAVPRAMAGTGWGVLGLAVAIGEFGPALRISHWVLDISPFTHVARVPGPVHAGPIVWLLVVAGVLTAVGLWALRRRDVPA